MQQLKWDDLRYLLVVARTGSLSAASRLLKVNRTTVLRRINALEKRLDCALFERSRSGYAVTPDAERLVASARTLETAVIEFEHQLSGEKPEIEGDLRVTTTDSMLPALVEHLASFHRSYPRIRIELAVTNHRLSLTRREADIAVRPTINPPENLWSRKIADIAFAIYASARYLKQQPDRPLAQHAWLGLDEPLTDSRPGRWLQTEIPPENVCLRADSFVALRMAAEQGLGLALMPCYLGDASRKLRRLETSLPQLDVGLWVLTHSDLARSARIRAYIEHLDASIRNQRAALLGTAAARR